MAKDNQRQVESPEPKMNSCRVCCEPIRAKALKCTHCGSYQDWTRHLLRWSALLVSLFALAPLWSISGSLSKLAFREKAARIEAAIIGSSLDEIRIAYENSGDISGIVTAVNFAVNKDKIRTVPDVEVRGCVYDDAGNCQLEKETLVSPNRPPKIVYYHAYIGNTRAKFIPESQAKQNCLYLLNIAWIDFAGSKRQLEKEYLCP